MTPYGNVRDRRPDTPARQPATGQVVDLEAHRHGWLLPRDWSVAHWFDWTPTGFESLCGKGDLRLPAFGRGATCTTPQAEQHCRRCTRALG